MCCGRGRFAQGFSGHQPAGTVPGLARPSGLTFEYIGRTRLIVTGRATGRQYRFERPGARLEVDLRDSSSIAAIPMLRKISPAAPRR